MTLPRDYSNCPPKKRAIALWCASKTKEHEVDENEAPEDLSLKTRERVKDIWPTEENASLHALSPIDLSTSSLNFKTCPVTFPVSSFSIYNSSFSMETKSRYCCDKNKENPSTFELKRSSGLKAPVRVSSNTLHNKSTLSPPTSCSSARVVLGERGIWSYHPYLPLAVYGMPPSVPFKKVLPTQSKTFTDKERVIRDGSTSPHREYSATETSESEGSPELRGEKLSCYDCGRGYATVAGLSRHQQFHCLKDSSRTFLCKYCPKTYTSMGALKMHIRTHTLPCKCHVCGKAFSRPWLLQGHIRTHTGEKPFECQQCHRSFADRSNLRAHLQTHADIKKYGCQTCPKTFSRMSLLVKHQDHGCTGVPKSYTYPVPAVTSSKHLAV